MNDRNHKDKNNAPELRSYIIGFDPGCGDIYSEVKALNRDHAAELAWGELHEHVDSNADCEVISGGSNDEEYEVLCSHGSGEETILVSAKTEEEALERGYRLMHKTAVEMGSVDVYGEATDELREDYLDG